MTGPGGPELGGDPVVELERFIAESEARGEVVPLEAYEMLARLRELMAALRGLTDSLDQRPPSMPPDQDPADS